jgi:hypothetical protein
MSEKMQAAQLGRKQTGRGNHDVLARLRINLGRPMTVMLEDFWPGLRPISAPLHVQHN